MNVAMDTTRSTGPGIMKKFAGAAGWLLLTAGALLAKPA